MIATAARPTIYKVLNEAKGSKANLSAIPCNWRVSLIDLQSRLSFVADTDRYFTYYLSYYRTSIGEQKPPCIRGITGLI